MEEETQNKITFLSDLVTQRLELLTLRINTLEQAVKISHQLSLKLLDIQKEVILAINSSNQLIQELKGSVEEDGN